MPCYAGGIDLDLPLDALLRQTDGNLGKGFRAIKMKVGRARLAEDVERVAAMREHLGDGFPLMVDANMKWTRRRGDPRGPRLPALDLDLARGADIPDDVAGHVRVVREGGLPIATGENLRTLWEFKQLSRPAASPIPSPTSPIAAASPRS